MSFLSRWGDVGKKIGQHVYMHRAYAEEFAPIDYKHVRWASQQGWLKDPPFEWNIIKISLAPKNDSFSLIWSPDFDTANEPHVESVMDGWSHKIIHYKPPYWIYHHKWLMVMDDYTGFDVEASKKRSLSWLGRGADSSRIGREDVWKKWLQEQQLENPRFEEPGKTAITRSRLSLPMAYLYKQHLLKGRILDYGSGKGGDVFRLRKLGLDIHGYDKYNGPFEIPPGKWDTITCNYVLNTIPENVGNQVVEYLETLLKDGGNLFISVRRDIPASGSETQRWVTLSTPYKTIVKKSGAFELYQLKRENPPEGFSTEENII